MLIILQILQYVFGVLSCVDWVPDVRLGKGGTASTRFEDALFVDLLGLQLTLGVDESLP